MKLLQNNFTEIKTIFFHEFGHFLSFKLRTLNLKGFEIEKINIYLCEKCKNGFGGKITPKVPPEYNLNKKLKSVEIAHMISDKYFGCVLQILLTNSSKTLEETMLQYGQIDQESIHSILNEYCLSSISKTISEYFDNFCCSLQSEKNFLFSDSELKSLLNENDCAVHVDIDLLELKSKDYINDFVIIYEDHIKKLTKILELNVP